MSAAIAIRGVTKRFGDHLVLDGIGLELERGTVTAVTGPNGSGKTTAARLLLGLETPDTGTVEGMAGLRRAAVFQDDRLCGHLDAVANVQLVLNRDRRADAMGELARVGLASAALEKPVRNLSGGQRRRVAIARAMAVGADLIILDEPFTGLDVDAKPEVMAYVRERLTGRTALLISHDPAEVTFFGAREVRLGRGPGLGM